MSAFSSTATGRYHKVPLKNVRVWEPCSEADATEWLPLLEGAKGPYKGYPIKPKRLLDPSINRLHVIVQPDGALWPEGCFYLFWCKAVNGKHQSTISNIAGDLADMMNRLHDANKDHNDFRGAKYERPTYLYTSELKLEMVRGKIKRKVANRKVSSMVGYYTWKVSERKFKPDGEMWKSKITLRRYTDKVGNTQVKEVLTNDLTFTNKESISTGRFIRDGGKLYPIERPDQKLLIQALMILNNPEMLLAHIVSLTSGTRLQSTLTLRHGDIVAGIGGNSDPNKYTLHYIEMGEGTLVETKGNKHQFVAVPAWVHNILSTYINSQRHKDRAMNSPIRDNSNQYVFLTRTGRPYYVAAADQHLFDYSAEAGSALRQFIRKVHLKLAELGALFTYRFHDLRATFGMNLLEDLTADVANGKLNQIELFDKLKHRLNHGDVTVTMAYIRYRDEHPKLTQAQMDFEIHLEELIRTRMSLHEKSRASNLQT